MGTLAVWRVTHLLHAELGPWNIIERMRLWFGSRWRIRLFDCFYCLSLWVAIPAGWLLGSSATERVFLWLACSGGAVLLERITHRPKAETPAVYLEDKEDELLRSNNESGVEHGKEH